MILNMITRLSELTEVDGSMTPLEELDDTTKGLESWRGAGCIDLVVNLFLQWSRANIYTLDKTRVLEDYDSQRNF